MKGRSDRMEFNPACLSCYLIGGSQDVHHDPQALVTKVDAALAAGATAFQYREKGTSRLNPAARLALGRQLRALATTYQVPFFVDDDLALAQALQADGIHVGQSDTRIQEVIAQVGDHMLVGYSCNTLPEVTKANHLAVDYLGSGPVYPTTSKADADPALGVAQLTTLVNHSQHPVVAIGGISLANAATTMTSGCAGLAIISAILSAADPGQAVQAIRAQS